MKKYFQSVGQSLADRGFNIYHAARIYQSYPREIWTQIMQGMLRTKKS